MKANYQIIIKWKHLHSHFLKTLSLSGLIGVQTVASGLTNGPLSQDKSARPKLRISIMYW